MKSTLSGINHFAFRHHRTPSQNDFFVALRPKTNQEPENAEKDIHDDDLICRQCRFAITNETNRITVNGAHCHTFANPHGIVFEIGCFNKADGCAVMGHPTSEFSWFPPNLWQTAICGFCLSHLGWRFSTSGNVIFWGLILDRLIQADL